VKRERLGAANRHISKESTLRRGAERQFSKKSAETEQLQRNFSQLENEKKSVEKEAGAAKEEVKDGEEEYQYLLNFNQMQTAIIARLQAVAEAAGANKDDIDDAKSPR